MAKEIPNLAVEVKNRLDVDPQSAFAWIQSLGTPSEVGEIYNQAVRQLYWLEKGARGLARVGNAGISFCLTQAEKLENIDPKAANEFKTQAKIIAYNLAANSWPGWGDEGVVIAKSDTEAGFEAALLNLKLALELKKPADKIAVAYWLLSAMQLALGNYPDSLSFLDQSSVYSQNNQVGLAFNEGFRGLILLTSGARDEGARAFDSGLCKLKKFTGNEEAQSFCSQLVAARRIFVKNDI